MKFRREIRPGRILDLSHIEIHDAKGRVIGIAGRYHDGWRFVPIVAGRGMSKRSWPSWEEALPAWAGALDTLIAIPFYTELGART